MGGVCSGGTVKPKDEYREVKSSGFSGKLKSIGSFGGKHKKDDDSYPSYPDEDVFEKKSNLYDSGELQFSISRELKPSTPARTGTTKVPQVSSFLGRAGIVGLDRAVEVLDTLGSSVSNLNSNSGFISGMASRGNRISILAFEIANTISKGANLVQSLSEENVQFLKNDVLKSEGVQQLVSSDMKELLSIAAADKREEFDVFSREVIRFGDLCKDPQWHNMGRFFSRLELDQATQKQQREEAEMTMQELTSLAQHTSELYHELNSLDRFEQDYRRKIEELESLHLPRKGESVTMLQSELKHQKKLVRSLKKKSLWAKSLEEVVEKLVDIVTFIHQEILEAFGDNGLPPVGKEPVNKPERLGAAGLALHYANVINQIDNIVSRPTSLPPNMRDQLYHGLPNSVKIALRTRCQPVDVNEELTIPQIKAEMEKTLQWLVPVATSTSKVHQGFGWVGEWANTGTEFSKKGATQTTVIRLQTLYHADKQKTDMCILELAIWLHRLISVVRKRDNGIRIFPVKSPNRPGVNLQPPKTSSVQLSPEDKNLLEQVMSRRRLVPGISKSQEFPFGKGGSKVWDVSRSTGNSPTKRLDRPKSSSVLDVMDGLGVIASATFTMVNKCEYTVWPGILSNAGIAPLSTTGFVLREGESKAVDAPSSWGGRFWGRTICSEDSNGKFSCVTGDCGSGKIECAGANAVPPATLAEFTLDGDGGMDFFDVSLVDGYNLPMLVVPQGGTGVNCTSTGCEVDLNEECPSELKVTSTTNGASVACKSACEAFRQDQYCCSGAYSTPDTCKPSSYSELFKNACPNAYSYAYDDKTSTFTCAGADYVITFCPSPNTSKKSSEGQAPLASKSPIANSTMVYEGASALEASGASSPSTCWSQAIACGAATMIAATWWWF